MFKQIFLCLTHMYIKCRAKCNCGNCCMSECMAEEGSTLSRKKSDEIKKNNKEQ